MQYVRLCKGLVDKGQLFPREDIFSHIKDVNQDWYVSVYHYTEEHYNQFLATGTIAGITDVTTNRLVFDFDVKSKEDSLDLVRADILKVISRLAQHDIKANEFVICYSGSKGFSIEIETTNTFTPPQLKTLATRLAGDLRTFDTKVYNPSRIFRVPLTKHNDSGLFKIPITLNELSDLPIEEIKNRAKTSDGGSEWSYNEVTIPSSLLALTEEVKAPIQSLETPDDIDLSKKPKWLSPCKFMILNGHFQAGSRNHALMALGATVAAQGFPKEVTRNMLEAAAELQARRTNSEVFSSAEIDKNIISVIYSPTWKGATYACKDHAFLQELCPVKGTSKCGMTSKERIVTIDSVTDEFADFAKNIDKNTIKSGIDSLDRNLRLMTSSMYVIAGSAGSGKCLGKDTPVLMFDGSKKAVQNIVEGELLMGDDGTARTVLSTCSGREKLYKVNQTHGDSYIVNASHILSLKNAQKWYKGPKKGTKGELKDMNIEKYLEQSKNFKIHFQGYKAPQAFKSKDLEIDPYILGYWLGNGTTGRPEVSLDITKHQSVLAYLTEYATSLDLSIVSRGERKDNGRTFLIGQKGGRGPRNKFLAMLRGLGVLDDKHIPLKYLTGSRKQRLALLAGLIDSDGHLNKKNRNSYEITLVKETLIDGVKYLCESLGFYCNKAKVRKSCQNNFTGTYFRLYINGNRLDTIPTKLEYKRASRSKQLRDFTTSRLSISNLGVGDYYGFEIDGNHRFLLGDFTVTHNTSALLNILHNTSKQGLVSLFGSADMSSKLVYQKIAQNITKLPEEKLYKKFKFGSDSEKQFIRDQMKREFDNVLFDFRRSPSIEEIREVVLETKNKYPDTFKLFAFDYISKINGPYSDDTANMAYVAPKLADLADEADICVISLAQVARSKGGPNTPFVDSRIAKGSGAIEEAATAVLGIWRPGYNTDQDDYIAIAGLKMRMGKEFLLNLGWNGAQSHIYELSNEQEIELEALLERLNASKGGDNAW